MSGRNDEEDETQAEAPIERTYTTNNHRRIAIEQTVSRTRVWLLAVERAAAVAIRRRTHHGPLMSMHLVPRLLLRPPPVGRGCRSKVVDHGTHQPTNKPTNKIECVRSPVTLLYLYFLLSFSFSGHLGIISINHSNTRTIFVRSFFSH